MRKRSLAETLVFVSLLLTSGLSVRACSGVHDRVRGCFGGVRVMFGYRSGSVRALFGLLVLAIFVYIVKNNTVFTLSVAITIPKHLLLSSKQATDHGVMASCWIVL